VGAVMIELQALWLELLWFMPTPRKSCTSLDAVVEVEVR